MLQLRRLLREIRGGELLLLAVSLVLAVASVAGIAGFAERLKLAMGERSLYFLAADRVLMSPSPLPPEWLEKAENSGISVAKTVSFRTMVYGIAAGPADEKMLLVALRAVSDRYPLLGTVQFSDTVYGNAQESAGGPPRGEIWLDSRAFAMLGIAPGAEVEVGEARLVASRVLVDEPDRSSSINVYGPRALMHSGDVASTGVVQPGSVVDYRYLFAGDTAQLDSFAGWLEPKMLPSHRWRTLTDNQPALAQSLDRAESYMLLAACLAVALASAAIALSAHRYGQQNIDRVALMKSLGASRRYILSFYARQGAVLLGLAVLMGGLIAEALQGLLFQSIAQLLNVEVPAGSWRPLLTGAITAGVCLLCFAAPPLWRLSRVSPMRVLRRDQEQDNAGLAMPLSLGGGAMFGLMLWFSNSVALSVAVMLSSVVLLLLAAALVLLCIRGARSLSTRMAGSRQRLAISNIYRRRYGNAFQLGSIALALMSLLSVFLLREVLLKDWQSQLAEGTPNYFLINIAESELAELDGFFSENGVAHAGIFPMVRGRLSHIDGVPMADTDIDANTAGLNREVNLSWSAELPSDNRLLAGKWWSNTAHTSTDSDRLPVSVESEVAERMGAELGTRLQFNIGGQTLDAEVTSIRGLDWQSMRPNFYFLFPANSLGRYASSYITSFYLPAEQRPLLVEVMSAHPTITLIEVDAILAQMKEVVSQLSAAISLIVLLLLVCALLVCVSNVQLSLDTRRQEYALLRTLGAGNRFLRATLFLEFAFLGGLAGLVAAVGANLCLVALQIWALDMAPRVHLWSFLFTPLASAVLVTVLAAGYGRRLLRTPAVALLRGR